MSFLVCRRCNSSRQSTVDKTNSKKYITCIPCKKAIEEANVNLGISVVSYREVRMGTHVFKLPKAHVVK